MGDWLQIFQFSTYFTFFKEMLWVDIKHTTNLFEENAIQHEEFYKNH